uniref:FERM domain-containing protein n=1 Tax=Knipowitschia caucasica TaxID=637954 RepID=A0AAV2LG93_KNICA
MKSKRRVWVFLPDKQRLDCGVGLKSRVQEVWSEVLGQLGLTELQVFALAVLRDDQYLFIDLKQKLSKYFRKGLTKASVDPLILFLRVQHYVDSGRLLQSDVELRLYFRALRQKVLRSQSRQQDGLFFQMASCALQAEAGDLDPGKHKQYFLPEDYFPSWLIKRRGRDYVLHHTPQLHEDLRGASQRDAVLEFVKLANTVQDVPQTLYKMRRDVGGRLCLLHDFTWTDLEHVSVQGCRLDIHAVGSLCLPKLRFHGPSALHCGLVLRHLRHTHRFHMSVRDALDLSRQTEPSLVCGVYRETYICDGNLLMQKLRRLTSSSTLGSTELETSTCEEDSTVQESEEVFVDSPDDVLWLAELFCGVSVDDPLAFPMSDWTAVTVEMKQRLKKRPHDGIYVD